MAPAQPRPDTTGRPDPSLRARGIETILPRWRDPHPPPRWPTVILLVAIVIAVWVSIEAKIRWDRVEGFCRSVQVGAPVDPLVQQARQRRLEPSGGSTGRTSGLLLVREHTLLGTFYCDVAYADGVVTSKRVGSL
ncbi:MAG TPA: hypothetical protein VFA38_08840 [Nitrospirales bacterium]|nr:hypothetical protein [Nitrospirales bacterium]